ncbi:MAG: outer membrane protein assembly factor BamA [Thermodesulfobacteriota bacterium]
MNAHTPPARAVLPVLLKTLVVLLLLLTGQALPLAALRAMAADGQANTVVLPPKINAPEKQEQLRTLCDQAFSEVLAAKGITLMPRDEVQKRLGYESWPPRREAMTSLALAPSTAYVATGSITRLGEQISLDFVVMDALGGTAPKHLYQTSSSEADLKRAVNQLANDILGHTGQLHLIRTVAITGNKRTDSGAILRHVKSQAGDRFAPELLREDIKAIFQMGYFDDVQILVEDAGKGKEVTFQVTEKAVIGQVLFDGESEIEEQEIKEVVSVSPNTIINTKEVQNSVENIRKLYKDKGFYQTTVNAKLSYSESDKVNVTFAISEGVKAYIRGIRFTGNTAFTEKELRKEMTTSEKGLFSWFTESGKLKRDLLEQDRSRIGALYNNHGYIEVKIGEPEVTNEGDSLFITFDIVEGDRYKVGNVDISGDLLEEKQDLMAIVELGKEEYFSRKTLREDMMRLTDRYAEKGYAFAEVDPRIQKNDADKRMDVTLNITKGNLIHINRITIKGNTRTRDKVIRREMQVKEGDILDASAVRKSSEKLQRLDFFEEVNITPEPTTEENVMDVVVDVKEKATGTFSVGAGYSSVDDLIFMGEISEHNFLGKGQRVALQANVSGRSNRYNFSFTEPRLNDTKLLFGYDIYNWAREYDDFTKDSTGAAVRFAYPIWNKWNLGWGYGLDDTQLSDVKEYASQIIKDSMDIETTSFVKVGVTKDMRDKLNDPSKGWLTTYTIKHAGGPLGGDSSFTKFEATSGWYYPLPWSSTFHVKGAIGYVMENEDRKLPVFERFFLGGLNTMRGFDSGKISPQDPITNERIGGEKMWYGNVEWIFPLVKEAGLKGVLFFDVGNVYKGIDYITANSDESDTWDFGDLRYSTGLGVRWMSPMGPLRLEWGYNLDPKEDEKQGVWDFSIGGSF